MWRSDLYMQLRILQIAEKILRPAWAGIKHHDSIRISRHTTDMAGYAAVIQVCRYVL